MIKMHRDQLINAVKECKDKNGPSIETAIAERRSLAKVTAGARRTVGMSLDRWKENEVNGILNCKEIHKEE